MHTVALVQIGSSEAQGSKHTMDPYMYDLNERKGKRRLANAPKVEHTSVLLIQEHGLRIGLVSFGPLFMPVIRFGLRCRSTSAWESMQHRACARPLQGPHGSTMIRSALDKFMVSKSTFRRA